MSNITYIDLSSIHSPTILHWEGYINGFYYEGASFDDKLFIKIINSEEEKIKFRKFCMDKIINKS